jgi:hypothetical protein
MGAELAGVVVLPDGLGELLEAGTHRPVKAWRRVHFPPLSFWTPA